ncbi:uncharacterized protein L201_008033 [Kwoniella dendrophila CBS 6074]|uniref:Uncharacterized protein n=1 Tax=Kwoniella dendrophila CBS 6074 TaxID=1295534 RepID=A0AAX4K7E5_9TREE
MSADYGTFNKPQGTVKTFEDVKTILSGYTESIASEYENSSRGRKKPSALFDECVTKAHEKWSSELSCSIPLTDGTSVDLDICSENLTCTIRNVIAKKIDMRNLYEDNVKSGVAHIINRTLQDELTRISDKFDK